MTRIVAWQRLGLATAACVALGGFGAACNVLVGAGSYTVEVGPDSSIAPEAGGDAPATDSSGVVDSGVAEAAPEASTCVPVTDASVPPQGAPGCPADSDGSTCYPQDTTSFSATWVEPIGAHLNVCTSAQISDYYTACWSTTSTTTACNAWIAANGSCDACLETPSTASRYGALVTYSHVNVTYVNVGGCIALAEPCNQNCGALNVGRIQCENAACSACGDFNSFKACASQAYACADCQDFGSAWTTCEGSLIASASAHPSVALCNLNAPNFQGYFTAIATFMCGK